MQILRPGRRPMPAFPPCQEWAGIMIEEQRLETAPEKEINVPIRLVVVHIGYLEAVTVVLKDTVKQGEG